MAELSIMRLHDKIRVEFHGLCDMTLTIRCLITHSVLRRYITFVMQILRSYEEQHKYNY